ncbi:MAG: dihydropteroate synthase [Candidatus Heimdallarchaeaceae archaeon]
MIRGTLGTLEVGDKLPVKIVGVVNLSSTSFFKDSIALSDSDIQKKVIEMIEEGVDCLDIGAQSTRPIQIYGGEGRVDSDTELEIVESALKICLDILSSYENIEISVDTQRKKVAERALNKGVNTINDISGFKKEKEIAQVIADFDASAVVMAARKEPGDVYTVKDILHELSSSIEIGLKNGIQENKLIIDPGIGSWEARDYQHDYTIIKNLEEFRKLQKPIYVGISRKTSIGKALNDAPPDQRLFGTIGATIIALVNGAHIVRTHDVKPTLDAIRVAEVILNIPE